MRSTLGLPRATPTLPTTPATMSARQLQAVVDDIAARRAQVQALVAQLTVFDEQLGTLETSLGPILQWLRTCSDLEGAVTLVDDALGSAVDDRGDRYARVAGGGGRGVGRATRGVRAVGEDDHPARGVGGGRGQRVEQLPEQGGGEGVAVRGVVQCHGGHPGGGDGTDQIHAGTLIGPVHT